MTPTDPNAIAADPTATPQPSAGVVVDPLSEPTFEECIIAWNEYYADLKAGRFNNVKIPPNNYFAYYGGQIIDHDPNFITLQNRAAAKIGVHWARLVIDYSGEPWTAVSGSEACPR